MKMARRIAMLFVLSGIMVVGAIAGGFQLNEQGARAMAQASAFAARATDPSAIYFNPAGLAFQDRPSFYGGAAAIIPVTSFFGPYQNNSNAKTSAPAQFFTPINVGITYPAVKGLTIGLSVNNPYGLGSKWPTDWVGRYLTTAVNLQSFFFNFSAGYQLLDNFSIGAGFSFVTGNVTIDRAVSIPLSTASGDPRAHLDLSGNSAGWNVGLMYKFTPEWSLGASWRGSVGVTATGSASFSPMYYQLGLPQGDVSTSIRLPATGFVGVAYTPKDKPYEIEADYQYIGWASYNELAIDFKTNGTRTVQPKNYRNTFILRIGGEYRLTDDIRLRAGYLYDHTPVDAPYVDPILPDANRNGINVGVGYSFTQNFSVDLAYFLLLFNERKAENTPPEVSFDGTYRTTVHLIGLNLGYTL